MMDFFHTASPKQLRPHQAKAIEMLRQSLARGNHRVVLQAPTGFGKTLTAAKIIESALAKGRRVLFTVPRLTLVDQAVSDFLNEGIDHIGVIQANHPRTDSTAPVQVASVQTLARRPLSQEFGLVIIDECHETYQVVFDLMAQRPNVHFLGLSATPWTRGLGLRWQDLCIAATIKDLIGIGFLSQFVAYAPDVPDLSGVKTIAGDYAENGLEEVMRAGKLVASVVETWLAKGENRPTLCFGVNRAHAGILHQQFVAAGVSSGYCDAYTDSAEMAHLARQFRNGDVRVVCSVRKLTTGIDWPVSCIIDAAPTKSEMLHVQKIGRGLRVNPGTEDLIILDHAGNSLRLGLVTDIFHGVLNETEKGKPERKEVLPKLPKECSACGALHTGLTCPKCGHERKPQAGIETVDGQLVQMGGRAKTYTQDEKRAWWSGIKAMQAERRRSDGWAAHTFRDKFGVWPRGFSDLPGIATPEMWNFVRAKDIRFAKSKGKAA